MAHSTKRRTRQRKTEQLQIRVSLGQKALFREAAAQAGISLSAWAVERLLRTARAELEVTYEDEAI